MIFIYFQLQDGQLHHCEPQDRQKTDKRTAGGTDSKIAAQSGGECENIRFCQLHKLIFT